MSPDLSFIALFREAAREFAQRDFEDIELSQPISSLGLDSIVMFEVIGFLEEKLGVRLPDEDLAQMRTLQDLADLVERSRPA